MSDKKKAKLKFEKGWDSPNVQEHYQRLCEDPEYVSQLKPSTAEVEQQIDDAMGVEKITLRINKDVMAKIREMANAEGIYWQAYLRKVISRHIE